MVTFVERRKRFFVNALLESDGQAPLPITAHTNNTGSMLGLCRPGSLALISPAQNPGRKLAWTLEALALPGGKAGQWVGVNTQTPNRFIEAAFYAGLLPWAAGYTHLRREVKYGESRLDALLTGPGLPDLWVECKNVTLVEDGVAAFPDAITTRGAKHLHTLETLIAAGHRAAMLYVVQRPDGQCFAPADYIDPEYARAYAHARRQGVEIWPVRAHIDEQGIYYAGELPLA